MAGGTVDLSDPSSATDTVELYDPAQNAWQEAEQGLPFPVRGAKLVRKRGGGRETSQPILVSLGGAHLR